MRVVRRFALCALPACAWGFSSSFQAAQPRIKRWPTSNPNRRRVLHHCPHVHWPSAILDRTHWCKASLARAPASARCVAATAPAMGAMQAAVWFSSRGAACCHRKVRRPHRHPHLRQHRQRPAKVRSRRQHPAHRPHRRRPRRPDSPDYPPGQLFERDFRPRAPDRFVYMPNMLFPLKLADGQYPHMNSQIWGYGGGGWNGKGAAGGSDSDPRNYDPDEAARQLLRSARLGHADVPGRRGPPGSGHSPTVLQGQLLGVRARQTARSST